MSKEMPNLIATFSDGRTLRRRSTKNYTHAWRVCWLRPLNDKGQPVDSNGTIYSRRDGSESGFASSRELAAKAATTVVNRISSFGIYEITNQEVVPAAATPL